MKTVYCPLNEKTGCGYWCDFGGYLQPFLMAFKNHIRSDHADLSPMLTRNTGGLIDRWIGDLLP